MLKLQIAAFRQKQLKLLERKDHPQSEVLPKKVSLNGAIQRQSLLFTLNKIKNIWICIPQIVNK